MTNALKGNEAIRKLIAMLILSFAAAMPLFAETETVGDYTWTYSVNGDSVEIVAAYPGARAISPSPVGVLEIPSVLGGKPVASIGGEAFFDCYGLTSVTIPDSVTNIGGLAFYGCARLTNLVIPDGVTDIGQYAFAGCIAITNMTMSAGVTNIGESAFFGCYGLERVYVSFGDTDRVKELMYVSQIDVSGVSFLEVAQIVFAANGGFVDEAVRELILGDEVGELPKPTRMGYVFEGWWTAEIGGEEISESTTVDGNATYYAHWHVPVPGTLTMTADATIGGERMKVTVKRTGGYDGRVAVKFKTQDASMVNGVNGRFGIDFEYQKEYLVWEDGDTSDKVVYVQTFATDAAAATTFRLKLSVQTTGDYADCVAPALASGGKVIVRILPNVPDYPGEIAIKSIESVDCGMDAASLFQAGCTLRVTVCRMDGDSGRVAVKFKTQDASMVNGINGRFGIDFGYVKEMLVWEDGDMSDKIVEIPTFLVNCGDYPRTFRLKLSPKTTGDYADCVAPQIPSPKVYVSLATRWPGLCWQDSGVVRQDSGSVSEWITISSSEYEIYERGWQ